MFLLTSLSLERFESSEIIGEITKIDPEAKINVDDRTCVGSHVRIKAMPKDFVQDKCCPRSVEVNVQF